MAIISEYCYNFMLRNQVHVVTTFEKRKIKIHGEMQELTFPIPNYYGIHVKEVK